MKRMIYMLAMLFFIVTALVSTGCGESVNDEPRRIVAPVAVTIPIEGNWQVVGKLGSQGAGQSGANEWIGKSLEFSKDKVVIGDYTLRNAGFKTRAVKADEYFLFNHKAFHEEIKIPSSTTNVITITEKDKFYCEVVELNESTMVLEINNYDFLVNKDVKDKRLMMEAADMTSSITSVAYSLDENIKSGVLLGIRTPKEKEGDNVPSYSYRTMWISSENKKIKSISEISNIIFPRKSGFWEIKVNRQMNNGINKDWIEKRNITSNKTNQMLFSIMAKASAKESASEENVINYLGNDYISIESTQTGSSNNTSRLMIVPVDSLPKLIPVGLTELVGEQNMEPANNNSNLVRVNLEIKEDNIIDKEKILDNIGLVRNSGHWYFKGRISYLKDNQITNADYRINLIPPQNLIYYDELLVKWTDIKSVVPDAIDAFTSPEKDIAIIITRNNKLMIYPVEKQMLGKTPLKTVKLNPGEAIMMAEWATGSYVDNWDNTLKSIK